VLPLPSGYEKRRGGQRLTDETYATPTSGEAGNQVASFILQWQALCSHVRGGRTLDWSQGDVLG
jgi:hypothetical protein